MELFIVDAFSNRIFGGNQAGVVLLKEGQSFPEPTVMREIAAELKHSETAFVRPDGANRFALRYFTPESEVDLCGHATISAFTVLREEKKLRPGNYTAGTLAGELSISVEQNTVWMEMAPGKLIKELSPSECAEVYRAFGLDPRDRPEKLSPCIVSAGLADILLPVTSLEKLNGAVMDRDEVKRISRELAAVGVHMFVCRPREGITAECRNFAPLYGIDEEAATGTSIGALTYRLFSLGLVREGEENIFVQGSRMGRPSEIRSRISAAKVVFVGGGAVISVSGSVKL